MTSRLDLLVIGAGISGLMAARRAQEAGMRVTVLDKGRGVGGRMSTRRIGSARADHGAQFITVNDDRFRQCLERWVDAGILEQWSTGFANADGTERRAGRPTYRGVTGMSALPKLLAEGLDVRTATRVTRIVQKNAEFEAQLESGESLRAATALLTAPIPQSVALLDAGGVEIPAASKQVLASIEYDPCVAVLVLLSGPSAVPAPGGLRFDDGPIAWIADNAAKGISDESSVTIHAGADYSRSTWDRDADDVGAELVEAARQWLGSDVRETQVHRWLYSEPRNRADEPFLVVREDPSLLLAGDAFGGASVEGAALSGLAAGEWLASRTAGP